MTFELLPNLRPGAAYVGGRLRRLRHVLPVLVVVGLLLGMAPPASAGNDVSKYDTTKIEPSLAAAIAKDPKKRYEVIVQAAPGGSAKERQEYRREVAKQIQEKEDGETGRIRHDLALVNGFAAELTGKHILKLAKRDRVKAISGDHKVALTAGTIDTTLGDGTDTTDGLKSMQTIVAQAPSVWADRANQGQGVTVAILDSGIAPNADLPNAVFGVDTATGTTALGDPGGHGTHVAGIVAGTGAALGGRYKGLAPSVRLLEVKVTNDTGAATYSSIIKGLQWVVANRKAQNIRVVNLSVGAKSVTSYKNDPLVAAVELAWFSGVVVVTSAGNEGSAAGTITVPGNDPYVITVGANNDRGTTGLVDDQVPYWSSRGPTAFDGLQKPDVIASGNRIVSVRSPGSYLERVLGLTRVVDTNYLRLSGTSMASPAVAGVAALVLAANPSLTPNQVKYVIKATAHKIPYAGLNTQGVGQVDALAAVQMARAGVPDQANKGVRPSDVFARAIYMLAQGAPIAWKNPTYLGRDWSNWGWSNGAWDSATWDNLVWENVDWTNPRWTNATWESLAGWSNGTWESATWDSGTWDSGTWDNGTWDSGSTDDDSLAAPDVFAVDAP
jgi:serine protease AprX